ncbi:hypothetical protein ACFE04_028300 [Oxalis oulophora]
MSGPLRPEKQFVTTGSWVDPLTSRMVCSGRSREVFSFICIHYVGSQGARSHAPTPWWQYDLRPQRTRSQKGSWFPMNDHDQERGTTIVHISTHSQKQRANFWITSQVERQIGEDSCSRGFEILIIMERTCPTVEESREVAPRPKWEQSRWMCLRAPFLRGKSRGEG